MSPDFNPPPEEDAAQLCGGAGREALQKGMALGVGELLPTA
jgi:hypothetical protein